MADSDVGKLFVGGISRDTTDYTLKNYFGKYGDVSFSNIAIDRITGFSRGFGFVTFSDPSSVDRALSDHHIISGRTVSFSKPISVFFGFSIFFVFELNFFFQCRCFPLLSMSPRFLALEMLVI